MPYTYMKICNTLSEDNHGGWIGRGTDSTACETLTKMTSLHLSNSFLTHVLVFTVSQKTD